MCNAITLPEGNPLDIMKGKKIVGVITDKPLSFRLDDGKILKLEIEQGFAQDLTGKPTPWLTLSLDEKILFRRIIN
ncbi:MAG: hypothetical protein AAB454_00210 [Patescibacteria group bacterium]